MENGESPGGHAARTPKCPEDPRSLGEVTTSTTPSAQSVVSGCLHSRLTAEQSPATYVEELYRFTVENGTSRAALDPSILPFLQNILQPETDESGSRWHLHAKSSRIDEKVMPIADDRAAMCAAYLISLLAGSSVTVDDELMQRNFAKILIQGLKTTQTPAVTRATLRALAKLLQVRQVTVALQLLSSAAVPALAYLLESCDTGGEAAGEKRPDKCMKVFNVLSNA